MHEPRLVFIGWGAVNSRIGALLKQRGTPVEIVGIATENTPPARAETPSGIPFTSSSDELFC
jgi:aspartate dehydrogenase